MKSTITLQINLSPGDVAYAAQTVPALLRAHPQVAERVLVIDVCKPQRTRIIDPGHRFPEPAYSERVQRILAIGEQLQADGLADRVEVLRPGHALFPQLSSTYLRPWIRETHDYGGCALMSYLAAFELCRTRHLLHYDADMLLYQSPGYDWAPPAIAAMARYPQVTAASPRQAPPVVGLPDCPTTDERLAVETCKDGWLNTWFSTRCYLFDMDRLRPLLPLVQGRVWWEVLATRLRGRGYPRSPEIMLFRRMTAARRRRLTLRDPHAWLLHPVDKGSFFADHLPAILQTVEAGRFAPGQAGKADFDNQLWREAFLHEEPS